VHVIVTTELHEALTSDAAAVSSHVGLLAG
jgi:hypothetical protein